VRPELGKVDTRAIAQGGAAMGRGLAGLGAGIGGYLKQQKEDKKGVVGEIKMGRMMEEMYGGESKVGRAFGQLADSLDDETMPWKNKVALAGMGSKIRSMIMHKSEVDTLNALNERKVRVSEGGLAVQQGRAADVRRQLEVEAGAGQLLHFYNSRNRGVTPSLPTTQQGTPAPGQQPLPTGPGVSPSQYLQPPADPGVGAGGRPGVLPLKPGSSTQVTPVVPVGTPLPGGINQVAPGTPEGTPKNLTPNAFLDYVATVPQQYRAELIKQADLGSKSVSYTDATGKEVTAELPTVGGVVQYPPGSTRAVAKGRMYMPPEQETTMAVNKAQLLRRSKNASDELEGVRGLAVTYRPALSKVAAGIELLASGDVKTGWGAEMKNRALAVGKTFGIEIDESLDKFQFLQSILGSEVMAQIGLTKGSVSEKEMAYFMKISANPGNTVEANLMILRAKARLMNRIITESAQINKWEYEGMSDVGIRKRLNEERIANPVINEAQMKAIYGDSYGKLGDPNANTGGRPSWETFTDDTGNMNPVPNR